MTTLEKEVRQVVEAFMTAGELFTALDVSNKVKLTLPFARHGEVRDIVRNMYTNEMVGQGWARSPIAVTLPNGQQETALLYHLLSDSWDLDNKYDAQRRAQAGFKPGATTLATPVSVPVAPVVAAAPAVATALSQTARDKWSNLFDNQPSLFPRK